MAKEVSIVCAWCTSMVASRGAQVSHGICTECAMEFIKKLPREYLASIADPDGTVNLFSDQKLDIETGRPR